MKKFLKREEGITLVALIITVVILLILATVVITSIRENKIISNAETAADKYNDKVKEEKDHISNYVEELEKHNTIGGSTIDTCKHEKQNVICTDGDGIEHYERTICEICGEQIDILVGYCNPNGCVCGYNNGGNTTTSCTHRNSMYYRMNDQTSHRVGHGSCKECGQSWDGYYEDCVRDSSGICIYCENDGTYVS